MAAYQALYRKYRPQTFDDVSGQGAITQTLKTQLMTGKLSHAYLFTGSRGTGKTTCAKILAKAVNCLNPDNGNPCNRCEACRAIDSGSCMDVLEIDAASNNGVDNVRDLRDDAIYSPSQVRKRVYIIDEVHMLSLSAFNALLKIVEEPPEHLLFILATTELHKVPATILSRCQRFAFRRISQEDIAARLQYVAYQENINLDEDAARVIARMADGAMRDGLSLLDQCASATTGELTAQRVYDCLAIAGEQQSAALLRAVSAQNSKEALELFDKLYADGKDVAALIDELICLVRDLLILQSAPGCGISMLSGVASDADALALAKKISGGELVRYMQLLQQTQSQFSRSANRRLDAELCLLELCRPDLSLDTQALNARLSRLEDQILSGSITISAPAEKPKTSAELPPQKEKAAPRQSEAQEQPPVESEQVPPNFWNELFSSVKAELAPKKPAVGGFFNYVPDNPPVWGVLKQDTVELRCSSSMVAGQIDCQETIEVVRRKAGAMLRHPVQVRIVDDSAKPEANLYFGKLIQDASEFPNVVKIH